MRVCRPVPVTSPPEVVRDRSLVLTFTSTSWAFRFRRARSLLLFNSLTTIYPSANPTNNKYNNQIVLLTQTIIPIIGKALGIFFTVLIPMINPETAINSAGITAIRKTIRFEVNAINQPNMNGRQALKTPNNNGTTGEMLTTWCLVLFELVVLISIS